MAKMCDNCKFYDTDYVFDDMTGDEDVVDICEKNRSEVHDSNADCPCFKKIRTIRHKSDMVRKFIPGRLDEDGSCEMIDCTTL